MLSKCVLEELALSTGMLAAPWGGGDAGLGASSLPWEMGVWVFYSPWASVNFGSSWGRMGPGSLWWGAGEGSLGQTL